MPPVNPNIKGRAYWRSLEEHADSPQFRELLGYAGTSIEPAQVQGVSRRRFLQVMGASMSLAGLTLTGCRRWPEETLAPYAHRPEGRVPGEPEYYATITELNGSAIGLLVESFDGRPIKIEGNPQHPFSLGATDPWCQASVLSLYDPDRSKSPILRTDGDKFNSWNNFQGFAVKHFADRKADRSSSVAVLTQPSASPSLAAMKAKFQAALPQATWYEWAPINRDNAVAGSKLAFGQALRPQHHLDKATVIACFDADILYGQPTSLKDARAWGKGRRGEHGQMNRLYVAEPSFTITGSVADERIAVRSSYVPTLLKAVAAKLGVIGGDAGSLNGSTDFVNKLVADLKAHQGKGLVVVGDNQPAEAHALAWAINEALTNVGKTVTFTAEPADQPLSEQVAELTRRANAGEIDTLLILGGNPVYDAPADLNFAAALAKVQTSIHLHAYDNETSKKCIWHLPEAHALEAWGDGLAWDGTYSIQQPLILPLFDGKSAIETLAMVLGEKADGYAIVRDTFANLPGGDRSDTAWRRVLHDGLLKDSAAKPVAAKVNASAAAKAAAALPTADASDFELNFVADASLYDGRWANNGWLQELPNQITKLTWDNAALVSVADAKKLGVSEGDLLKLTVGSRSLDVPAMLVPGQAKGAVTVALGYGRTAAGNVGDNVGHDTYKLRTTAALHATSVKVAKAGGHYKLVTTTHHDLIDPEAIGQSALTARIGNKGESGSVIKEATLEAFKADPHVLHKGAHGDIALQLFEGPHDWKSEDHAWGMTIDMSSCIGCNACVVACHAENNVPVVGKDQVDVNREMHWLRIDRYYKGDPNDNPQVVHQPVMCVQCENAPCEQVCPVNASVHDVEGLNVQVYNRCIGTRYCSNNCPYKVRRFNFFDYHSKDPRGSAKPWNGIPDTQQENAIDQIKRMVFNPDVTVRMRGVMEKCTYCVQRISRAKIKAKNEWVKAKRGEPGFDRSSPVVQDGEVVTACQQSCPTEAIVFGNLNDPNSKVSKLQKSNRAYSLLSELNTRPRTRHLAKLRNPADSSAEA